MPRQTGKSSLSNAIKKTRNNETRYGVEFGLPPGIKGGVAQLSAAEIGAYSKGDNKGEKYLRLAGVMIEPKSVTYMEKVWEGSGIKNVGNKTERVEGRHTSIMIPLCETTKRNGETVSLDENVDTALNELRKIGADTSEIESEEDLEQLLDALLEVKPYFVVSTSEKEPTKDFPNQGAWENWNGSRGLEDYVPSDGDDLVDNTGDAEESEPQPDVVESDDEPNPLNDDWDDLVDVADDEDHEDCAEAQKKLIDAAVERGISKAKAMGADSWQEVADMIREAGDPDDTTSTTEDSGDEEVVPDEGDHFSYDTPYEEWGRAADEDEDETAIDELTKYAGLHGLDVDGDYVESSWSEMAADMPSTVDVEVVKVYKTAKTCDVVVVGEEDIKYKISWSDLKT